MMKKDAISKLKDIKETLEANQREVDQNINEIESEIQRLEIKLGPIPFEEMQDSYIIEEIALYKEKLLDIENNRQKMIGTGKESSEDIEIIIDLQVKELLPGLERVHDKKNLYGLRFALFYEQARKMIFFQDFFKQAVSILYDRQRKSLKYYLKKAGYIIPADVIEFWDWYIKYGEGHKLTREEFAKRLIQPSDFNEFHQWKEASFLGKMPVVKELEAGKDGGPKKKGRPKSEPYLFENIILSTGLQKLLDAGENAGLIKPDKSTPSGYKWIEVENMKRHHVQAFWQVAVDAAINRMVFKNEEKITEAIRVYFGMKSLSKDTLSKVNPNHYEYKRVKKEMQKILPSNSWFSNG